MVAAGRTVHSGTVSPAPGAALRPFPRPANVICGGVLVTRAWAMRGAPRTPTRVLASYYWRRSDRPLPFLHGSPSQHTARPSHCVRQASISTMVCEGGGRAAVLADGGVVKGRQSACARTCKHTLTADAAGMRCAGMRCGAVHTKRKEHEGAPGLRAHAGAGRIKKQEFQND